MRPINSPLRVSGLDWLESEQTSLRIVCQQVHKTVWPQAHVANAAYPALQQSLFLDDFLAIQRQTHQHLSGQGTHQQIAMPLWKL